MSYLMGEAPTGGGYQPAPATAQDKYPRLNRLLHSEEGFKRNIVEGGGAAAAILLLVVFAIGTFGYNCYMAVKAIRGAGYSVSLNKFIDMFIAGDDESKRIAGLGLLVWLMLFCVAAAVVLWVIRRVRLNATLTKLYDRFCQKGFLAELTPAGVTIDVGNKLQADLFVFGLPGVSSEWVVWAAQQLWIANTGNPPGRLSETQSKALLKLAHDAFGDDARQLNEADSSIPPGVFVIAELVVPELAHMSAGEGLVRVAVPRDDLTKVKLYTVKHSALLV